MTETELKSDVIIRDELLLEAHEIMAAILLRAAIQLDIKPEDPLGQRIQKFSTTLRTMGIVNNTRSELVASKSLSSSASSEYVDASGSYSSWRGGAYKP